MIGSTTDYLEREVRNAIEALNRQLRKAIKANGLTPEDRSDPCESFSRPRSWARKELHDAGQSLEIRGDKQAGMVLNDIGDEVERAIDELREFAHGVYPALLTSSGLRAALASVRRRTPGWVTIQVTGVGRYSPEIETAVYFSCLAALDNAVTHAGSASVTVRVWDHVDALYFTISDTGPGFDPLLTPPGAGITRAITECCGRP